MVGDQPTPLTAQCCMSSEINKPTKEWNSQIGKFFLGGQVVIGLSLEGLGPGIEAEDFLEVPNKLAEPIHVRVDVLLHPLFHRVREINAVHV